jgi:hypothetical protein
MRLVDCEGVWYEDVSGTVTQLVNAYKPADADDNDGHTFALKVDGIVKTSGSTDGAEILEMVMVVPDGSQAMQSQTALSESSGDKK